MTERSAFTRRGTLAGVVLSAIGLGADAPAVAGGPGEAASPIVLNDPTDPDADLIWNCRELERRERQLLAMYETLVDYVGEPGSDLDRLHAARNALWDSVTDSIATTAAGKLAKVRAALVMAIRHPCGLIDPSSGLSEALAYSALADILGEGWDAMPAPPEASLWPVRAEPGA